VDKQEHFGQFRLERLLGAGGMGEVWLAFDTLTERNIALKVLPPHLSTDETYRHRFMREAKIVAGLREPHIVPIHSFGAIDGQLYIDMALIEGRDLSSILKAGRLTVPVAVDIAAQAADALDSAHDAGLVHRDVKPSNLFVTDRKGFVYLIDFGIAQSKSENRLTSTGWAVGTLAYMAPERFSGDFDASVDVYALACVLHHCLTGEPPFGAATTPERQMHGHLTQPPPPASQANNDVPSALDAVIARAMAKNPADRYSTAGEFGEAARAALTSPLPLSGSARVLKPPPPQRPVLQVGQTTRITGTPPPAIYTDANRPAPLPQSSTRPNRSRFVFAAASIFVVLLIAIAGYLFAARDKSTDAVANSAVPSAVTTAQLPAPQRAAVIAVGSNPIAIAVDSTTGTAYVTNGGDSSLSIVDVASATVRSTVKVGKSPAGVAVDPQRHVAYVVNNGDNSVSVIDTDNATVVDTIVVGGNPWDIAIDGDTGVVFVANQDDGTLSVIENRAVVSTIKVGANPIVPQVDTANHTLYVSNLGADTVSVVDTIIRAVVATIKVGDEPNGLALDPPNRAVYVTNRAAHTVSVIDTASNTVTATIPVGTKPVAVAVDPEAHTAYVSNIDSNSMSVIDTIKRSVTDTLPTAKLPVGLAVDPRTHSIYLNSYDAGSVEVFTR
jgi:serine/threonine protein kinase, bacterial